MPLKKKYLKNFDTEHEVPRMFYTVICNLIEQCQCEF